jgi:hypothetical protein
MHMWLFIKCYKILQTHILGWFATQNFFIVLFDTVHPEDGRRRRPKHVGVVSKQL